MADMGKQDDQIVNKNMDGLDEDSSRTGFVLDRTNLGFFTAPFLILVLTSRMTQQASTPSLLLLPGFLNLILVCD